MVDQSLFIVTGVSGSGKTNIAKELRFIVDDDFDAFDMDLITEDYDKFHEMGRVWLKIAHWNAERGRKSILSGSFHDYQLTGHDIFREFANVYYCYLTCSEEVRKKRLTSRGGAWTDQNIQHAIDWDYYLKSQAMNARPISLIDTSFTTPVQAAEIIWQWIKTLSSFPIYTNYVTDPWS